MITTTTSRPPLPAPVVALAPVPARYEAEDLGELPDGAPLLPVALNDHGELAASSGPPLTGGDDNPPKRRGFLRKDGQLIPAGVMVGCSPVNGLSSSGILCGRGRLRTGATHGWATHLGLFGLDCWPETDSHAMAVNRDGWVCGYVSEFDGNRKTDRAFLASPEGQCEFLTPPQSGATQAVAINDRRVVVLNTRPRGVDDYESFSWLWHGDRFEQLSNLGVGCTWGSAITARGVVVGRGLTCDGRVHALRWSGGDVEDLNPGDAWDSEALGANDAGVVVGRCLPRGGERSAFRWTAETGLRPLAEFVSSKGDWVFESAIAVNALGVIAGIGRRGNQARGFLLHPR